jgi:flagellar basal-body rod modification protein FlgD
MAIAPVSSTGQVAQSAFGLDFQSLLQIILTQLTSQDPLKPMDNFQFVSQLAQFSQLQQAQSLNDTVTNLLSAQAATQATSLLGKTVDLSSGQAAGAASAATSGVVKAVSFSNGTPSVTILTGNGQTIANIAISTITTVR